MEGTIADVRCLSCGAPAKYDVVRQSYVCAYCGGRVEVSQAQAQKQGFRQLQQEKIRTSADAFRLQRANCTGCGAQLIFEENEAQSSCAFCGRELVRKAYASSKELPEMILPFRLTEEEARVHPYRNIITRALGTDETVEVDVEELEKRPGDLYLLCSDGLSEYVQDEGMLYILRKHRGLEEAADVLLNLALEGGGRDNISLVLAEVTA